MKKCPFFKKDGECPKGEECFHRHNKDEKRGKNESIEDYLKKHNARSQTCVFFVPQKIMKKMLAKGDGISDTVKDQKSTSYNLLDASRSGVIYNQEISAKANTEQSFDSNNERNPYESQ